jgi:pimeloyl-ACP methyl ester carboxylesterase
VKHKTQKELESISSTNKIRTMKTKSFSSKIYNVLASLLIISTVAQSTPAIAQTKTEAKNIVIVHGAFVDASSWENVFKILKSKGYNVTMVQNPLTSLEDDVAATNRIVDKQNGPVVLVGHSWGGSVITQAGVHPKVVSLVYVAAFMPEIGESTLSLVMAPPTASVNGILPPDDKGFIYYDKDKFQEGFAADVNKEKTEFLFASQAPVSIKAFTALISEVAWKTKPSYAIVATEDNSINPIRERAMYKRGGAKVTELKGSHAIFISKAKAVADVIEAAAKQQ